jgi:hypothetical protein
MLPDKLLGNGIMNNTPWWLYRAASGYEEPTVFKPPQLFMSEGRTEADAVATTTSTGMEVGILPCER